MDLLEKIEGQTHRYRPKGSMRGKGSPLFQMETMKLN